MSAAFIIFYLVVIRQLISTNSHALINNNDNGVENPIAISSMCKNCSNNSYSFPLKGYTANNGQPTTNESMPLQSNIEEFNSYSNIRIPKPKAKNVKSKNQPDKEYAATNAKQINGNDEKKSKKLRGKKQRNGYAKAHHPQKASMSNYNCSSENNTDDSRCQNMKHLKRKNSHEKKFYHEPKVRGNKAPNGIHDEKRKTIKKSKKINKNDSTTVSSTNLDSLLLRYQKSKKRGMVGWREKSPLPTAYFGITIEDGRNRKQKRNLLASKQKWGDDDERVNDVVIYATGLNMPVGYTQVMEGFIQEDDRALIRVLDPDSAGPFVEFKIRVENSYGVPCKQMCLVGPTGRQRYRRCARRVVRLSNHAKFSDPIQFYKTADEASLPVRIGRDGTRRRRKPDYLVFRCE